MSGLQTGPLLPTSRPQPNATGGWIPSGGVATTTVTRCRYPDYNYDVATAVICGMYLVFGVVYSLFGYRCFKAVMFLTGFIFGSIIVYLICLQEKLLPAYGNAGVALGAGLLFGLITMLVQYVGLFMTGFHTGLFAGVVALATAEQFRWQPATVWTSAAVLLGSGLLAAVLNLYWQKGLTVLGTSVYGGAIMAGSLDYFVEKFLMVKWVWDRVALKPSPAPCWFGWLILAVWPLMVFIGIITQWAVTGRGIHHQELVPSKKARNLNMQQRLRTREQRAELRQKKYRYLYQVRTAHGDVISQSYVQALQRKVCGPGPESNTLQSDSTHLTILAADQAQQLTALTESEDDSRDLSADIIQLDRRHHDSNRGITRPPYR
jgi:hypothetical protein